jgi:hypothetical protein
VVRIHDPKRHLSGNLQPKMIDTALKNSYSNRQITDAPEGDNLGRVLTSIGKQTDTAYEEYTMPVKSACFPSWERAVFFSANRIQNTSSKQAQRGQDMTGSPALVFPQVNSSVAESAEAGTREGWASSGSLAPVTFVIRRVPPDDSECGSIQRNSRSWSPQGPAPLHAHHQRVNEQAPRMGTRKAGTAGG